MTYLTYLCLFGNSVVQHVLITMYTSDMAGVL
jgi:hypothetical protein